jgi:glycosyltransferase involved in cell wall biosynthesis
MQSNLHTKQTHLAKADVIVSVSRHMASVLRARAPELARARIETIPNALDLQAVQAAVEGRPRPIAEPYALFVGKLARNKGAGVLVDAVKRAGLEIPVVVIGDGPERAAVERDAAAAGCRITVLGWLDRAEVFRWMSHATLLIFPSTWPEPLSRVLIEASALSVPIAAMDTGGTSDIVVDEETGLLSSTADELGADVVRLARDPSLRTRLGSGARRRAESHFDATVVIPRMEALYKDALA